MWQDLCSEPQESSHDTPKRSGHCRLSPGKDFPAWNRKSTEGLALDNPADSKKNAADVEEQICQGKIAFVPAPEGDAIEIDEICIQVTPSFWVWIAVSRLVGQVLGFVFGDRTDSMLPILWGDVPADYRDKPVYTDKWGAYEYNGPGKSDSEKGSFKKFRKPKSTP